MSLQQRVKKIEVAAAPMIEEATRERKRRNLGKFSMCRLLCFGFTHAEALEILARVGKRQGRSIADLPHCTDPQIFEMFQSFLDDDAEAARLYSEITANRVEGVGFEETLKDDAQLHERVSAIAHQIQERLEAYFLERDRTNYLEYKVLYDKGMQKAMAENEQATIKSN